MLRLSILSAQPAPGIRRTTAIQSAPQHRSGTGTLRQDTLQRTVPLFRAQPSGQPCHKPVVPKKVIYAGSFDPPTNGHLWMIEQAAGLFDHLTVVMAVNPDKKYTFSTEQRLTMLKAMTRHLPNVEIVTLDSKKFLVDYARKIGAVALIRGLRNGTDFEQELALSNLNRKAAPEIQTLTYFTPKHLGEVSSSNVRGLAKLIGWRERVMDMVHPVVYQEMKAKVLEERFMQLGQKLGIPAKRAEKMFNDLKDSYTRPDRTYHNLDHLLDILEAYDNCLLEAPDLTPKHPALFELALWFHDIVDDRGNPLGVNQSAKTGRTYLGECSNALAQEKLDYFTSLVMATKYGSPEAATALEDAKLLTDIDLSILGAPEEKYNQYRVNVRKEYPSISDADYRAGRSRVLGLFEQRDPLYQTRYFQENYEARAKANLRRELQALATNPAER